MIGIGTHPPPRDGFTLIEVLVAFALLGLMSVMLFGGLRFGARAWERGGDSVVATNDVAAVRRFLSLRLAEAAAPRVAPEGDFEGVAFHGGPDAVRFIADWPDHLGGRGPTVFEVRYDRETRALLLDWALLRADGPVPLRDDGRLRPRPLLGEVEAVQLRYFGHGDDASSARWTSEWDAPGRLPALVEVRVDGAEHVGWPPLIVALAAERGASNTEDGR